MTDEDRPTAEELAAIIEEHKNEGTFINLNHARKIYANRIARAQRKEEARPLYEDLREAGFGVESIYDLLQFDDEQAEAVIPIVLRHVVCDYNYITRFELVDWGLRDKAYSAETTSVLLDVYSSIDEGFFKDNLASRIADHGHESLVERIVNIVADPDTGDTRVILATYLVRVLKTETALEIVQPLLKMDQKWVAEVIEALGEKRAVHARKEIVPFLEHSDSYVRERARRAVSKIDARIRRDFKARNRIKKPRKPRK